MRKTSEENVLDAIRDGAIIRAKGDECHLIVFPGDARPVSKETVESLMKRRVLETFAFGCTGWYLRGR